MHLAMPAVAAPSPASFATNLMLEFIDRDLDVARELDADWFAAFEDCRLAVPGQANVDECLTLAEDAPTDLARGLILGQLEAHLQAFRTASRRRLLDLKNADIEDAVNASPSEDWLEAWEDSRLAIGIDVDPTEAVQLAFSAPTSATRGLVLGLVLSQRV